MKTTPKAIQRRHGSQPNAWQARIGPAIGPAAAIRGEVLPEEVEGLRGDEVDAVPPGDGRIGPAVVESDLPRDPASVETIGECQEREEEDRQGIDYWASLTSSERVSIDLKVRDDEYADLLIEVVSNTRAQRELREAVAGSKRLQDEAARRGQGWLRQYVVRSTST